ncbi:MAG: hypothetical protein WBA09_11330 [Candidatus Acidiferrum sp.]
MPRRKSLILVIESDHTLLPMLMIAISANGYRVIGVHNIEGAYLALDEHDIDAVYSRRTMREKFAVPLVVGENMRGALGRLRLAVTLPRVIAS